MKPSNRFEITVQATLNRPEMNSVLEWLNLQHLGKTTIPLDEEIPKHCREALLEANYNVVRTRSVKLTIEVDTQGNWTIADKKV